MPPSLVSQIYGINVSDTNSDWTHTHVIKLREVHAAPLEELVAHPEEYEDKFVITTGNAVGLAPVSHESWHKQSYGRNSLYQFLFALATQNQSEILGRTTIEDYYAKSFRVDQDSSGGTSLTESDIPSIYLRLDISKTLGSPVVVGGLIEKGKLFADMYVFTIGNKKEVYTIAKLPDR